MAYYRDQQELSPQSVLIPWGFSKNPLAESVLEAGRSGFGPLAKSSPLFEGFGWYVDL